MPLMKSNDRDTTISFNFFLMRRDLQSNIDATVLPKIDAIMFIICFTSGYHDQQLL